MSQFLLDVVREIESHVAADGWDQPPRLFALVRTDDLAEREPELAKALGLRPGVEGLTPVEQDELPDHASLDDLLAAIGWPDLVEGAALVVERLVLPPEAEADLPLDEQAALALLAEHPLRREIRIAVGVRRGGEQQAVLRLRAADDDEDVLHGHDLVPGLSAALAATLEP